MRSPAWHESTSIPTGPWTGSSTSTTRLSVRRSRAWRAYFGYWERHSATLDPDQVLRYAAEEQGGGFKNYVHHRAPALQPAGLYRGPAHTQEEANRQAADDAHAVGERGLPRTKTDRCRVDHGHPPARRRRSWRNRTARRLVRYSRPPSAACSPTAHIMEAFGVFPSNLGYFAFREHSGFEMGRTGVRSRNCANTWPAGSPVSTSTSCHWPPPTRRRWCSKALTATRTTATRCSRRSTFHFSIRSDVPRENEFQQTATFPTWASDPGGRNGDFYTFAPRSASLVARTDNAYPPTVLSRSYSCDL